MRQGDRLIVSEPFVTESGKVLRSAPILLFQLDNGNFSEERGYDHQPYSSKYAGVPDDVALAQRAGFGLHLPDVDVRQIEWM